MNNSLREEDVEYRILAEHEDAPVRGCFMSSGDPDFDREVENEIIARLDRGHEWAWCRVRVEARWQGLVGVATLGGCSFENESDFIRSDDCWSLKLEALAELNAQVVELREKLSELDARAERYASDEKPR